MGKRAKFKGQGSRFKLQSPGRRTSSPALPTPGRWELSLEPFAGGQAYAPVCANCSRLRYLRNMRRLRPTRNLAKSQSLLADSMTIGSTGTFGIPFRFSTGLLPMLSRTSMPSTTSPNAQYPAVSDTGTPASSGV